MTRIVFMGTPAFSAPILRMLVEEGYNVVAAVTQPDRPVGRKKVMTPPPVKEEALKLGLPVLQPEKLRNSEELRKVLELEPDLVITAAFGQILPNELLETPRLGAINVHASLLPEYRGGAPIHQAIIDGKTETGVTIMYMTEKLDAGDIISQTAVPIENEDHTGRLFDKLSEAGKELLRRTLPDIIEGKNSRIPQDSSAATFARNISREQERIDWTKSARDIYNQIRGLHPWPVAYTTLEDSTVKIWWAEETGKTGTGEPGEIAGTSKEAILVQTGSGLLAVTDLQMAGKKRMPASEYMKNPKFQTGGRFL